MNKKSGLLITNGTKQLLGAGLGLSAWVVLFFLCSGILWAQGHAQSFVNQAAHAHGDAWQGGAVKNWVARGSVTVYRYDEKNLQSQETFPLTLLHAADVAGGGSKGDKLQRLLFKAPEAPPDGSAASAQNFFLEAPRPDRLLTRAGTDGKDQWHSSGPFSTAAAGRTQRFIESQTERSLEALFNFQKQGKNVDDVTARVAGLALNGLATTNDPHRGRAHAIPSFEAAKNHHVMELSDPPGGPNPHDPKSTRYFIDDATALITRLEFEYDTATDPISHQPVALTEVYEFSDYRDVPVLSPNPLTPSRLSTSNATVKFPFRIDRYVTGQLVESLIFTQVMLNSNLHPENFRH